MFFIRLPGWTQNPHFMSRPCLFQFQVPWGRGLCLPLNEVHIASRSPWGPRQSWTQPLGTGWRAEEQHLSWEAGRLPLCHPDFTNHPNNSLHPGATSLLGEGSFKLVASEHNKLKTRQRLCNSPVGTSGFMSPSYLLLSNESSVACFHFEAAGQIGSHWSHA